MKIYHEANQKSNVSSRIGVGLLREKFTETQQGGIEAMDMQITFSPEAQDMNKNAETLREEIDYESEFKSLKDIAGRHLNLGEIRCERLKLNF